jgi:hypothetical protein
MDSNSGLHKQLLAQEVVKVCCNFLVCLNPPTSLMTVIIFFGGPSIQLRREVAQLRAARQDGAAGPDNSKTGDSAVNDQLKTARIEIARLEAEKQEIIAQANTQKEKLAKVKLQAAKYLGRVVESAFA